MRRHTVNKDVRDESKYAHYAVIQSDKGNLIKIHVEPLWRKHPNLWFEKIESIFANCNVEDDNSQFNFLISLLDEETALEIKDVIFQPPDEGRYDYLRDELIKRITAKNEEEAEKKMMAESMGNRTPSEFYCHLSVLAGCYTLRDKFIQEIWLKCLPDKIRAVVECLQDNNLDTLTKVADRVHKVFFSPQAEQHEQTPATSVTVETLVKEVEILNRKVQTLKPRENHRARSKFHDVQCDVPSKPQKNSKCQPTTACQFHTKYGVKLCAMRKNNN